jgi:signal transduction histidine kinase
MWVIAVIRDVTARKTLEEQSRATHAHLLVSNDRERIARDLHDSVIQQLFACGLTLQAVASVSDGHVAQRIESTIDDLDGTISVLRDAIFDLQRHNEGQAHSVRIRNTIEAALQSSNASMAALEGTELLDQLPQSLVSDIDAVIRELITNAIRHGNPRRIAVLINDSDGLVVEIRDDGRGFSFENPEGNGLPNLRTRAMQYGGHFSVSRDISNLWTIARWAIPGGNHA